MYKVLGIMKISWPSYAKINLSYNTTTFLACQERIYFVLLCPFWPIIVSSWEEEWERHKSDDADAVGVQGDGQPWSTCNCLIPSMKGNRRTQSWKEHNFRKRKPISMTLCQGGIIKASAPNMIFCWIFLKKRLKYIAISTIKFTIQQLL